MSADAGADTDAFDDANKHPSCRRGDCDDDRRRWSVALEVVTTVMMMMMVVMIMLKMN